MVDGHAHEPGDGTARECGESRPRQRDMEDAAGNERAADPRERPDERTVILEKTVRDGERKGREEDAHEHELDAGGAREESRVHAANRREAVWLDSAAAGG